MTDSKLFKKKNSKDETEKHLDAATTDQPGNIPGSQENRLVGSTPKTVAKGLDDDEGTVRLSYDISRRCHKALKVASAQIECTILELLEELISKHLLGRDIELIAADYYKARKVKTIKIR